MRRAAVETLQDRAALTEVAWICSGRALAPKAGPMIRVIFAVLGLCLLSACTDLETTKPLLTTADERGAPALRPGVWLLMNDPGRKFDERGPMDQWPDLRRRRSRKARRSADIAEEGHHARLDTASFIFAAGDPRIIQFGSRPDDARTAPKPTTMA